MNMEPDSHFHLHPGEIFVTGQGRNIVTLLGSCVAVCFWDPKNKIAGMNHVVLPKTREGEAPTSRFGNVATFVLLDMMLEEGAKKENLVTRVFGGASRMSKKSLHAGFVVGDLNLDITIKVLHKLQLKISHQDVGGELGRRIQFNSRSGEIEVKYLQRFDFEHEGN